MFLCGYYSINDPTNNSPAKKARKSDVYDIWNILHQEPDMQSHPSNIGVDLN